MRRIADNTTIGVEFLKKHVWLTLWTAAVVALLLAVPAAAFALDVKPSPVKYKKTTLRSNYMKYPANAISVGRVGANKGKILAACGAIDRIVIIDPDTGQTIREYGEEYGVNGLDDVVEGPDGTLYFSNIPVGTIGYIRPDGTHGSIPAKPFINSLIVTRDGKWLYYGIVIGDDQLWRIELENGLPKKGAKAELLEQNPGWSNSMDASDDGHIYSPLNVYGEIRKIDPNSGKITTVFDNVEFPSSVEINDATGILYVSEFHLGYITRIDPKIKDPRKAKRVLAVAPPGTDNVAVEDGPNPRIYGSSFMEDMLFEAYENGDPMRIIAKGGVDLPFAIHVVKSPHGDRIFVKDLMRVREWFPAENRYHTIANATFQQYLEDKAYDYGHVRFDPKRLNWLDSVKDSATTPWSKIMQPTPDGNMLVAGAMFEAVGNRLMIIDIESGQAIRTVGNLDAIQDAIMVGKDIYMIEATPKEWPVYSRITHITPDDKRQPVFTGKNFVAFTRTDKVAFVSDAGAGTIYQVVKDGKWLDQPIELVSGLKGPQGMNIANDGNLIVMEINEGYNGRMLKVDLRTKEVTLLAEGLGVNRKLEKRNWKVIFPYSVVAQTSDGAIYFTEPGITSFSVLRPQQ